MTVKVFPNTFIQTAPGSPGGTYCHTLTTPTDLTIATAPGSNSRWDVVVAKVFDDGTTPVTTVEVLTGTAAASPTYPTNLTSPPTNTNYYPLAKIVVGTSVSSIVNANISFPAAAGGLPTFGQFTTAPGGSVPVANLTAAAALPLYTPFYSIADRSTGRVLPGGASIDTHQLRFIRMASAGTNSNGDINPVPFGLYLAGTFTAAPFPNGCFGFTVQDASNVVTLNTPLTFKTGTLSTWVPTASGGICRVYNYNGTPYASSLLDIQGIAWGW